MDKILFEVKTRKYKSYYVLAVSFDKAKLKAEQVISDEHSEFLIDEDGSLKNNNLDEVFEIKCLSKKLIF